MRSALRRSLSATYLAVVTGLACSAFADPHGGFTWSREGVAMLLCLPTLIPALPPLYLIGAGLWAWHSAGAPMWLVTAGFSLMFAGIAAGNLWVLRRLSAVLLLRLSHRRHGGAQLS